LEASSYPCGRGAFLRTTGAGLAASAVGALSTARAVAATGPAPSPPRQSDTIRGLLDGNARFVADKEQCPPLTARRLELAEGQHPSTIILSCSDSRVPVETVFDEPPGNIFGVRIAGNFVTIDGLGSIEYAVAELKSSVILVLGHTECGAVHAAVNFVKDGTTVPGHIQDLANAIAPAARATKGQPGDWVMNAVTQNVRNNVSAMTTRSKIVADAVRSGSVAIAGGVYDLRTGKVTVM
jgi:carbonic anhydrase